MLTSHISESMCVHVNRAFLMLNARAPFALPLTLRFHSGMYVCVLGVCMKKLAVHADTQAFIHVDCDDTLGIGTVSFLSCKYSLYNSTYIIKQIMFGHTNILSIN